MKKQRDTRKIWLVEHPLHQYTEDVKELARRNSLKIIDAKFEVRSELLIEKAPKLTLKSENKVDKK